VRVVLDPNVLVSALITPRGRARQVVQAGIAGEYEYVVCPALLGELHDVASRPRIARLVTADASDRLLADIRGGARSEPDPAEIPLICPDPDDDYLVALAVEVGADHLVSGDAALLGLKHPPVSIISLRTFADLLVDARQVE
jgi:putative PIN family toxin of toxin-antitoxin system